MYSANGHKPSGMDKHGVSFYLFFFSKMVGCGNYIEVILAEYTSCYGGVISDIQKNKLELSYVLNVN